MATGAGLWLPKKIERSKCAWISSSHFIDTGLNTSELKVIGIYF